MINYLQEAYEIECYPLKSSGAYMADHFAPSIQSLKSAQDIIRRYEKGRRRVAKQDLQRRETVSYSPQRLAAMATGDNIFPLHSLVWARPSSRLSRCRHYSAPYILSPTSRARRASPQREAWRAARYVTTGSKDRAIFSDVQSDMLERFGVMAIQGLAVFFGLSGLLVLLKLF